MTDEQTPAPEAGDGVVQPVATEATTPEAAESTKGQDSDQPAKDDAEGPEPDAEAEEQSKSKARRERRKAAEAELKASEEAARRDAEAAQRQVERVREAAQNLRKPTQADYDDYDDYTAALSAYHTVVAQDDRELRRLEAEAQAQAARVQQVQQQKDQEAARNWEAQTIEAKAKYPDFEEVALSDNLPIGPELARFIVGSDVAAEVAYAFGKNPSLVDQMNGLSPVDMARAFGRLEAQVSAPKPTTTSNAPEPIRPVRGKATAVKDPAKMSMAEYRAAREAGKL